MINSVCCKVVVCVVFLASCSNKDNAAERPLAPESRYSVSTTVVAGSGNVLPDKTSANRGAVIEIVAYPDEGFVVDSVSGCEGSRDGNRFVAGPLKNDCTLEVAFVKQHEITSSAHSGGRISPSRQVAVAGQNMEFSVTPDEGYVIESVVGCGGELNGSVFRTASIQTDCSVLATFSPWLDRPNNFRSEVTDDSVLLLWDEVPGADEYHLYCSTEPHPRLSGRENPCQGGWLKKLASAYHYITPPDQDEYYTVVAYKGSLSSLDSEQISVSMRDNGGEQICHVYFSSDGSGSGDSINDPASISTINSVMSGMNEGGTLCLLSGIYSSEMVLNQSGSPENPFTIVGINGYPIFKGSFDSSSRLKTGSHAITIRASNLHIENILFRNVGVCFRMDRDVRNVTLKNFHAADVATCVDVARYRDHSVRNLTIDGAMILRFTRSAILLGAYSDGVSIINSYIDMQPGKMGGRGVDYVAGISLYDQAKDITIDNTTVLNVIGKFEGYSQGDGIVAESGVESVRVKDSYLRGHQDGCIDTKAADFTIDGTVAAECKRNYRFWENHYPNGAKCKKCISYDPTGDAHFSLHKNSNLSEEIVVYSRNDAGIVYSSEGGMLSVSRMSGVYPIDPIGDYVAIVSAQLATHDDYAIPPIPNSTRFQP